MDTLKVDTRGILVVDDDAEVRETICCYLRQEMSGFTISEASDGNTSIKMWEEIRPSIIILDMMLPRRSGFSVLERVRQMSGHRGLPYVIMITANEGSRHKSYAEHLGVDKYMIKPVKMSRLHEVIIEGIDAIEKRLT